MSLNAKDIARIQALLDTRQRLVQVIRFETRASEEQAEIEPHLRCRMQVDQYSHLLSHENWEAIESLVIPLLEFELQECELTLTTKYKIDLE